MCSHMCFIMRGYYVVVPPNIGAHVRTLYRNVRLIHV